MTATPPRGRPVLPSEIITSRETTPPAPLRQRLGPQAYLNAIRRRDPKDIRRLAELGVDVNTPLSASPKSGGGQVGVEEAAYESVMPFLVAVALADSEVVQALLDAGASPNSVNRFNQEAKGAEGEAAEGKFNAAVEGSRSEFVKEMVKRGHKAEDLNEFDPRPKRQFYFINFLANDENRDVLLQFAVFAVAMLVLPVVALFGALHVADCFGFSRLQCDCLGLLASISVLIVVAGNYCYRAYKEEVRDYPLALKKHEEQKAAHDKRQQKEKNKDDRPSPQAEETAKAGDDGGQVARRAPRKQS